MVLKKDIREISLEEIQDYCISNGLQKYVSSQVYSWLWKKSCISFDDMTNLSLSNRDKEISEQIIKEIKSRLNFLVNVGLDYIKIGQSATTLSGGEAQRIKLSKELSKRSTGKTLYILDEPTTGLHFDDVKKLLNILHKLVDEGNTVIVIEHNLDVIKTADYIIDLGPLGGVKGGEIVGIGTPEDIAKIKKSFTGGFLKQIL